MGHLDSHTTCVRSTLRRRLVCSCVCRAHACTCTCPRPAASSGPPRRRLTGPGALLGRACSAAATKEPPAAPLQSRRCAALVAAHHTPAYAARCSGDWACGPVPHARAGAGAPLACCAARRCSAAHVSSRQANACTAHVRRCSGGLLRSPTALPCRVGKTVGCAAIPTYSRP